MLQPGHTDQRKRGLFGAALAIAVLLLASSASSAADDLEQQLQILRSVDRFGKGNQAAASAWQQAASAKADQIPTILAALDGANPIASNWISAVVDAIAERELADGGTLSVARLQAVVTDARHGSAARRLAFDWLARVDAAAPDRLIPKMLDDPELEFRRAAIERLLKTADAHLSGNETSQALAEYQQAFAKSRDIDQVKQVAAKLKELKAPYDMPRHLGLVAQWKLIGPFDNTALSGFDVPYPPEEKIDPTASYEGKSGRVAWIDYNSTDEFGMVDLNKALGKANGVVGYAAAEFVSPKRQPVEIRLGSGNAHKLWLNGKLLSKSKAYHTGERLDQFVGHGELEAGKNLIVLKVLQNEQTESWAQDWQFQLRVCDSIGTAVLAADRPATQIEPAATTAK